MNSAEAAKQTLVVRHYFVDEAGDPTLFGRRGKVLIGTEGCSKFFMLGVAHVPDPVVVTRALEALRADLLADPYFRGVPSMQPEQKKTAICFHAKNDLQEVRREVLKLLPTFGVRVQAIVRRKESMLSQVRQKNERDPGYRYRENEIYDDCLSRLFKNLLHQADENRIVFARRGESDRMEALAKAIEKAKSRYEKKWSRAVNTAASIHAAYPSEMAGLQVVDYYLWALQRMYEKEEDRFFNLLRADFSFVMDVDDQRRKGYGEYYDKKNVLELNKMKAP
jgi:Protein of unknown function (DUF3800)